MWFTNKKGILERCGKNEKDVRWLDRAIRKGIIIHDTDMGYITTIDYIDELEREIEELKKWNKSEVVASSNVDEVKELKERLGYVWGRLNHVNRSLIHVIYSVSKGDKEKEMAFKNKIWYKDDERESVEREWASENWII